MAILLLLPYIVLGQVGAAEAHIPATLACLGSAFAIYWFGCVEDRFRLTPGRVLLLGLAARACLLPMPPSDDMHRFLWEGRILWHGFNPYRLAPIDPALMSLRDADWALINHPDMPTIYPPVVQALFCLLALPGTHWLLFKLGFVLFDGLGFAVLRHLARNRTPSPSDTPGRHPGASVLAVFFLNPLLIFEIAGRGHFDSVPAFLNLVFLAALAGRKSAAGGAFRPAHAVREAWAPVMLGLGALTKITSLALAPLLLFSLGWRRALAWGVVLAVSVGGSLWAVGAWATLGEFATRFRFNAALPSLIDTALPFLSAPGRRAFTLALFLASGLTGLRLLRRAAPERQALGFMGLLLIFSPTLHPWYLLWILPFAALAGSRPWLLLSGTILLSYEVYARAFATGRWIENPWLRWPEYLPPFLLFLYLRWKKA